MADKRFGAAAIVCCAAAVGFLGGRFSLLAQGPAPTLTGDARLTEAPPAALALYRVEENDRVEEDLPPVNINQADEEELQSLPGVGPAKAANIVAYRRQNGPFENKEELMAVEGIGEQIFMNIRDRVTIGP